MTWIVILITSESTVSSVKCELHANEIKVEKLILMVKVQTLGQGV